VKPGEQNPPIHSEQGHYSDAPLGNLVNPSGQEEGEDQHRSAERNAAQGVVGDTVRSSHWLNILLAIRAETGSIAWVPSWLHPVWPEGVDGESLECGPALVNDRFSGCLHRRGDSSGGSSRFRNGISTGFGSNGAFGLAQR